MKIAARFVLLSAILVPNSLAQPNSRPPCDIHISAGAAEKLLIHKEPVACPWRAPMAARVTGTVVVVIDITKAGNVLHPAMVSGPAMLRKAVLDAVRKYKYKPYLLNGEPVEVETTVPVQIDTFRDCPSE